MGAMAKARRKPEEWAYMKMLHGKHVNTLHLISMMRRHNLAERNRLIERMLEASGQIAISAQLLTRRQREKYTSCRLREGNRTYYLFNPRMCPADIGCRIDLTKGELVYS